MNDIIDVKNQKLFKQHARMLIEKNTQEYWFLAKDVCKILKYNKVLPTNNFFIFLKKLPLNTKKISDQNVYINKNALFFFIIKSQSKHGQHFRSLLVQKILPNFFFGKSISNEVKKNIMASSPVNLRYDYNDEEYENVKDQQNIQKKNIQKSPPKKTVKFNKEPHYETIKSPKSRKKSVKSPKDIKKDNHILFNSIV